MGKVGVLACAALGLMGAVGAAQEPWSQPRPKWSPAFVTPELAIGPAALEPVPRIVAPPAVIDPGPTFIAPPPEAHPAPARVAPRPEARLALASTVTSSEAGPAPAPGLQPLAPRFAPDTVVQVAEDLPAPTIVEEPGKPSQSPGPGPGAPLAEIKPKPAIHARSADAAPVSVFESTGRLVHAPPAYMDPRTHAWTQHRIQPADHLTVDEAGQAAGFCLGQDRCMRGCLLDRWRHLVGEPKCTGPCQ